MIVTHNRFNNWLNAFNKKHDIKIECTDLKDDSIITYDIFNNFKQQCYSNILFLNIKTLDMKNFVAWYGWLYLEKLDKKLFNLLRENEGFKIYNMSLKEKCKVFFNDYEYKIIVKYLSVK